MSEKVLSRWKCGSNSYWKMAGALNYLLRNEMIHKHYGLLNVGEYLKKLHEKRMEADRVVLDWKYNSLFS